MQPSKRKGGDSQVDTITEDPVDTASEAEVMVDLEAAETGETAPNDEAGERSIEGKHIFISHKCDVEPDENIARQLYDDLKALGANVYLDKAQPIGVPFDQEIQKWLKRADFVVALLTSAANASDWVTTELTYAHDQFQQRSGPIIFPMKLGTFDFSMAIRSSVRRFNSRSYDPNDYKTILEDVIAGIINEPLLRDVTPIGLEGFLVPEFRKSVTRAASVPSVKLQSAVNALQKDKLFWVVGHDSVRNHFARCVAVEKYDREVAAINDDKRGPNIYEISRSRNWSRVDATLVQKSIIVFPDVTSQVVLEQDSAGTELEGLKNLVERNFVIVTASEETYSEIEQEMRNRGLAVGAHILVGHDFYDERAKLTIFEQLLDFSSKSGDVTPNQLKWARRLVTDPEEHKTFKPILAKWFPADIERFVMQHLRRAKRQGDVLKLLQRNAHLDDEIHDWFITLDDSTRCFVLALTMFSGLRKEQLWQNYKLIVQHLKKLDSNLALWPLGICCERAEPYITGEGQVDFADERIREAMYREITKSFRNTSSSSHL